MRGIGGRRGRGRGASRGERPHTTGRSQRGAKRVRASDLSFKEKQHLIAFGQAHPANDSDHDKPSKYRKIGDNESDEYVSASFKHKEEPVVEEDSSDSEAEVNPVTQLLRTFGQNKHTDSKESADTDDYDESEDSDDENDSDELESENSEKSGESSDEVEDAGDMGETSHKDVDTSVLENDTSEESEEEENGSHASSKEEDEEDKENGDLSNDSESETEEKDLEDEPLLKESDFFTQHFENLVSDSLADQLLEAKPRWTRQSIGVATPEDAVLFSPSHASAAIPSIERDLQKLHVKQVLCKRIDGANKTCVKLEPEQKGLTALQQSLFSVMNNYQDLCYPDRTFKNGEEVRLTYCLHALNHLLKTRSRVMSHNQKLNGRNDEPQSEQEEEKYRDQGYTRPKVLIVLPFREAALRVVNMLSELVSTEQNFVTNKARFIQEFGDDDIEPCKGRKPEDYEATFAGNTDDHFRMGLSVTKKSLKLFTDFYVSDIIVASVLGLRTIIGAEGDKDRDFDFLSSIEVLIFDQTDLFQMQNWDHVLHLMSHLHRQPKDTHGMNLARVRTYCLNGWSKLYRQTLVFSSIITPEITNIFNHNCFNYSGKVFILKAPTAGAVCRVVVPLLQKFYRFPVTSVLSAIDDRMEFFTNEILPLYSDESMSQTLVFVSSYFDFVRLRRFFRQRDPKSFVELSEDSSKKEISTSRNFFFQGNAHFLLFTERFHFFHRYRLRGIRHFIFYDLPQNPQFYPEICNMLLDIKASSEQRRTDDCLCSILFSKFDVYRLTAIVGTDRATHMIQSADVKHSIVTSDK